MTLTTIQLSAQENFNLSLVTQIPLGENGNDVWGYVDDTGLEYAIMGTVNNTIIWSLQDPSNPIEVARIAGDNSTWRDIKSWEDHIYVTTDTGDDGLLVVDMSMAPDSIRFQYITPEIAVSTPENLGRCHNLYIDENGFCYLAGCRITGANKAIILDLNQDKWNPPIVGIHGGGNAEYAHDLYVKNNMLYSSEINVGELAIFDATDKGNLIKLGSEETSFSFTHNAWTSDDQNFVFTTDERANAYVDAYDISDPTNITRVDRFRPLETEGRGVIPHNTHYFNGYLVTSYYTDGVVITDANDPSNLIKVGSYDTFSGNDGGFNGCWGAYPFLPSGLVLASDRNTGLYILESNYVRAALLQGLVSNAVDNSMINAVSVSIVASQMNDGITDPAGLYKTGLAEGGTYDVTFTHPDFEPLTVSTELTNGETTILDVELVPLARGLFSGQVLDSETGEPIPNAIINLLSNEREESLIANENGLFSSEFIVSDYNYIVGSWGHKTQEFPVSTITENLVFELDPGFRDEFALDLGWQTFGDALTGEWVRDVPIATFNTGEPIAPGTDVLDDIGGKCYVTGNGGGAAGNDDVDNGTTVLVSPDFNISGMMEPTLQYRYWFANAPGQGAINDTMFVQICDDVNCITVDSIFGNLNFWSDLISKPFGDLVDITQDLRIEVTASDIMTPESSGHITEAAFDVFEIIDGETTSTEDILPESSVQVYPNPFEGEITISSEVDLKSYSIYDAIGNLVQKGNITNNLVKMNLNLASGIYTFKLNDIDDQLVIKKIVKK